MRKWISSLTFGSFLLVALTLPGFSQEKPASTPTPAAPTIAQPAPKPNPDREKLQARTTVPTPRPTPEERVPHTDRGEARAIPTLIIHGF